MDQIGKLLVGAGLGIAALGALLWLGQGIPWLRLGRLPGDISIQRDGYSIFLPITTMVLVSIFASLIFWLIAAVRR
jgi:heme/copper-type cytochrome/quinol oxidase subunit 2